MINGIQEIKPIETDIPTQRDLLSALLVDLGCSVSNMPRVVAGDRIFTHRWEVFDPEEVTQPEYLPEYWRMVWDLHNAPDRKDCVSLRYRYVHCPKEILGEYPRVPCSGIFALCDRAIPRNRIKAKDLIHIGNDFPE